MTNLTTLDGHTVKHHHRRLTTATMSTTELVPDKGSPSQGAAKRSFFRTKKFLVGLGLLVIVAIVLIGTRDLIHMANIPSHSIHQHRVPQLVDVLEGHGSGISRGC